MPIEWAPFSPKQLDFFDRSTARLNIADGPIRSGKTIICLVRWGEFVRTGPPGDLMIVGTSERTIKRNVIGPLMDIFGPRRVRHVEGKGELYLFGRRIFLVGANNAGAETRVRGVTLAGAYGNEITLWPENVFKQLVGRLSIRGAKFFGDTNPDSPNHWLHRDYLANEKLLAEGILRRWQFTLDDNLALDPEYRKSLESLYTGLWYKRMILGQWVLAEGAVYDFWDEAEHTVQAPPHPALYHVVGIDYGTSNPAAFGLFGVNPGTKPKIWLEKEYYWDSRAKGRQKTDAEYSADLKEFLGPVRPRAIYLDPSAASFKVQLRKDGFSNIVDADNSVVDGIRTQARMLKSGEYRICKAAKQTIADYTAYVWDPKAQERGEDAPLKQNDHTKDMERYVLHTLFGDEPQVLQTGRIELVNW